jgi:hypothetical protein
MSFRCRRGSRGAREDRVSSVRLLLYEKFWDVRFRMAVLDFSKIPDSRGDGNELSNLNALTRARPTEYSSIQRAKQGRMRHDLILLASDGSDADIFIKLLLRGR